MKVDSYVRDGKEKSVTRHLRFIDSFRFMRSGLAALVDNLDHDQLRLFSCLTKGRGNKGEEFDLLSRKGVYPYDHVDSLSRLDETFLPPKEAFYSKLNDEGISDEDYEHAQKVWEAFRCQTMRNYHDLYLKTDVYFFTRRCF